VRGKISNGECLEDKSECPIILHRSKSVAEQSVPERRSRGDVSQANEQGETAMGKGILMWLIGIPIPIILIILLLWN
jgi:hypothetical protein